MVQAPDTSTGNRDLPETLALLNEMNTSAQHVASLVDNMIQKVHKGELSTDQGLSFLEMKYNMLLSYIINLTFIILKKCCGEKIDGESDPCINRLIEIRTVLEKIRPIDKKLKYQIDKIVKSAVDGGVENSQTLFKPAVNALDEEESSSEEEEKDEDVPSSGKASKKFYVPPKLSAVHYTDETAQERNKRLQERSKKHALSLSIMQDLQEEYLDTPVEISQSSRAQQLVSKQRKEKEEYEEEYLTRLPVTKVEKQRNRHLTTLGTLGDEILDFGRSSSSSTSKRKRKRLPKTKGKNYKRKKRY